MIYAKFIHSQALLQNCSFEDKDLPKFTNNLRKFVPQEHQEKWDKESKNILTQPHNGLTALQLRALAGRLQDPSISLVQTKDGIPIGFLECKKREKK